MRSIHPWLVLAILLLGAAVVIGRVWSSTTPSRAQTPADAPSGPRIYTLVGNGAFSVDDFGELPSKAGKRATEVEAPFGEELALAPKDVRDVVESHDFVLIGGNPAAMKKSAA